MHLPSGVALNDAGGAVRTHRHTVTRFLRSMSTSLASAFLRSRARPNPSDNAMPRRGCRRDGGRNAGQDAGRAQTRMRLLLLLQLEDGSDSGDSQSDRRRGRSPGHCRMIGSDTRHVEGVGGDVVEAVREAG
ncbi:unnamed protein product [Lampetra fluviatilis]